MKNEEKGVARGNHRVGKAWNPENIKSSGLPDRLKRVIGDEKNEKTCWGPAARDACHTVRGWRLMFLLVVGTK